MLETITIDAAAVLRHLHDGEFDFCLKSVRGLGYCASLRISRCDVCDSVSFSTLEEAAAWLGARAVASRRVRLAADLWELEMIRLLAGTVE